MSGKTILAWEIQLDHEEALTRSGPPVGLYLYSKDAQPEQSTAEQDVI